MVRAISVLALSALLAAPVLAQNQPGPDRNRPDNRGGGAMGGVSVYPAFERRLPNSFWAHRYRLTPGEYYRLRAMGFSQDEVFMIANAADVTGLGTQVFADAIYRGLYARQISLEYGILPSRLTRVREEWRTPEWAAATGEPAAKGDTLDVYW